MTGNSVELSLIQDLKTIVGTKQLLTDSAKKKPILKDGDLAQVRQLL